MYFAIIVVFCGCLEKLVRFSSANAANFSHVGIFSTFEEEPSSIKLVCTFIYSRQMNVYAVIVTINYTSIKGDWRGWG